jgi:hypothetical protein
VKPNAFLPHPVDSTGVSVYRTLGWTEDQVQGKGFEVADERESNHRVKVLAKGESYPEQKRMFKHLGRAQIATVGVRQTGLDVTPDEPPPGHAEITGWPLPDGLNKKDAESAHLLYAAKLASVAKFIGARQAG